MIEIIIGVSIIASVVLLLYLIGLVTFIIVGTYYDYRDVWNNILCGIGVIACASAGTLLVSLAYDIGNHVINK